MNPKYLMKKDRKIITTQKNIVFKWRNNGRPPPQIPPSTCEPHLGYYELHFVCVHAYIYICACVYEPMCTCSHKCVISDWFGKGSRRRVYAMTIFRKEFSRTSWLLKELCTYSDSDWAWRCYKLCDSIQLFWASPFPPVSESWLSDFQSPGPTLVPSWIPSLSHFVELRRVPVNVWGVLLCSYKDKAFN
jgi:hypothetical protein